MPLWIEILFLLLSLALGVLPLYLLRRYDIHDPEPFPVLAGSALVGGFVSSAFALLVFSGIEFAGVAIEPASLHSFLFIGPVEEAAKLAGYLAAYKFFREYFDEPVDYAIYMGAVAIGFSAVENAAYAAGAQQSGYLLLLRLMVATPVHVIWSLFIGLGIARFQRERNEPGRSWIGWPVARGFLIAALLHGLWDFAAFRVWPWILLNLFLIWLFFRGRFILSYLLAGSHLRPRFAAELSAAPESTVQAAPVCPACGNDSIQTARSLPSGLIYSCPRCEHSVASRDTLLAIFHYYGSLMQGLMFRWRRPANEPEHRCPGPLKTLIAGNYVCGESGQGFFKPTELAAALEEVNGDIVARYRRLWLRV